MECAEEGCADELPQLGTHRGRGGSLIQYCVSDGESVAGLQKRSSTIYENPLSPFVNHCTTDAEFPPGPAQHHSVCVWR